MRWVIWFQVAMVRPEKIERRLHHLVHLDEGQHGKMVIKSSNGLLNGKVVVRRNRESKSD